MNGHRFHMVSNQDHYNPFVRRAQSVFAQVFLLNTTIAVGKIVWGFSSHTLSMAADGFHSLLDAAANVIGIVGLHVSSLPPDEGHPYGHRKFEALSAVAISFFMFLAGFNIISTIIDRLFSRTAAHPEVTAISYCVMLGTLAVNLLMSKYEQRKGLELKNSLLLADSKHTFSDLLVTLTVIITLLAVQLHFPFLDIIASLVIVMFILHAGFEIIMRHIGVLIDAAILNPDDIQALVLNVPGVAGCHKIRSRGMQDHVFIDLHIQVSKQLSIEQAHHISYAVEECLKNSRPGIVDVLVHVEEEVQSRSEVLGGANDR